MNIIFRALIALATILSITTASAHHSFSATFKSNTPIDVEGTVTGFSFKNPHVLVYLDVKDADGNVTNWAAEGAAATLMRRAGWSRDTFKTGDLIRITGDSTHDGSPMVAIAKVVKLDPDTKEVLEDLSREGDNANPTAYVAVTEPLTLESGKPNVSGNWAGGLKNARRGPPRAPDVPFNEKGAAIQATYDLSTDAQVFCDAPGVVRQSGLTPHPFKITQYDDRVVIDYEEYGGHREIYFDASRPILGIKTHLGDSVARYEGDSLIIETTNLLSNLVSPEGNRLSDQATTTEIYSRADDAENGAVLDFKMIVNDPLYLTEPLVLNKSKTLVENYEMIENDCRQPLRVRTAVSPYTSFFLTSKGVGDGANLGGLAGADAHCEALAESVGAGGKSWAAYLSTTGDDSVNARDRIGSGPWYNSKGVPVALNVADLHSDSNNLSKSSVVDEHGQIVNGREDKPNRHDVLTGSLMDGTASSADADTTCSDWTSNGEGSALVGHHDRVGGGDNPTSWNNAHPSRGCGQEDLQGTGGDGLFYCFAAEVNPAVVASPLTVVSEQAPVAETPAVVTTESADKPSPDRWFLYVLLAIVAIGIFFLFGRKKS